MKYIFTTLLCASGYLSNAQFLDNSIDISKETINGSARYRSMGGAFTALGGDISALKDNPAGGGIFRESQYAVSLSNNRSVNRTTSASSVRTEANNSFNLNHLGVVFVFPNYDPSSKWKRFSFSATFDKDNSYNKSLIFDTFESQSDGNTLVNDGLIRESAGYKNLISGNFSANYDEKLSLGVGLSATSLNYQSASAYITLADNSDDLVLENIDNYYINGSGIALKLGAIYKVNQKVRLGLSYESPTWYDLNTPITYDLVDNSGTIVGTETVDEFVNFRSPQKVNGGIALVLGKFGLLSGDVSFKNYQGMKWNPSSVFPNTNYAIKNDLRNTINYRLGSEFRFNNLSLRAGYRYEESPYEIEDIKADLQTFSVGLGYKFNRTKFDLSYDNSNNNYSIFLYGQDSGNRYGDIDQRLHNITGTLSVNF